MIDFLKGWITNIVTLAVILVLLEMLIPGGKIKKNIKLVAGLILMIAVLSPLAQLIKKPINLKDYELAGSTFINKKEIESSSRIYKEKQMKQMVEVYRQRLVSSVEECSREAEGVADAKAEVIINEDYNSSEFGMIKRVYITLTMKGVINDKKTITMVEKVDISSGRKSADKSADKTDTGISEKIRKQIEDKLNRTFSVQKENIILSLQTK